MPNVTAAAFLSLGYYCCTCIAKNAIPTAVLREEPHMVAGGALT